MEIGTEKESYEVISDFLQIPDSIELGLAHAIVEDRSGRLYLYHNNAPCMLVFDATGQFLNSWGDAYAGGAHGCFLHEEDGEEFLYLANTDLGTVTKNRLDGEELWTIRTPSRDGLYRGVTSSLANKRFIPTQVAVDNENAVYVVDGYGEPYCHIFHQVDGKPVYTSSFGGVSDNALGSLNQPHGIEIDERDGRQVVLIANRKNNRIDAFSLEGDFIETVVSKEDLRFPCGLDLFEDRIVVPDLLGRVSIYDKKGNTLLHLGDSLNGAKSIWDPSDVLAMGGTLAQWPGILPEEREEGIFYAPHDVHVIRQGALRGSILVSEWLPQTVERGHSHYGQEGRITFLRKVS